MPLFDDVKRDYLGLSGRNEHQFAFLNRSAKPVVHTVRETLEHWFQRYPPTARDELRTRFRDANSEINHKSACFELFLHELFHQQGCKLLVHPEPLSGTGRRPDFLLELPQGGRLFLEAIVATGQSAVGRGTDARLKEFYQTLEKLNSPDFFLEIRAYNRNPATPPPGWLRRRIQQWLDGLDYDRARRLLDDGFLDLLPEFPFTHEGETIFIRAIPKGSARSKPDVPPIAIFPFRFAWGDPSVAPIKDAILKKASRYKALELPYVVAVQDLHFASSPASAETALFGHQDTETSVSLASRAITRDDHGAWTGPSGPTHTRVSGGLFVHRLFPWGLRPTEVCLYHNPFAPKQVPANFPPITRAWLREDGFHYEPGRTALALLNLPADWPGHDFAE